MFNYGVVGKICCDITFSGLPAFPSLGHEIFSEDMNVCAGGVFTTTAWLSKIGANVSHVSTIGNDIFSQIVMGEAARLGVDTTLCRKSAEASPEVTFAIPFEDERALVSYSKPEAAPFIDEKVLANTQHLHVGGIKHLMDTKECLKNHSVSLSIGTADAKAGLEKFEQLTEIVDIFFVNAEEARILTGCDDIMKNAAALGKLFPTAVITDGENGAYAYRGGITLYRPAFSVELVDPTGAGDSFVAGFLEGSKEGLDEGLRLGAACSAFCVGMVGTTTDIPDRDTLYKFVRMSS